jgi:oligoribonuclease NrnB/cAMP/cGMP phosphodiesterase (DHH superfamily)
MNETKITCYYHNDLDGIASAAIFNLVYPNSKLIKINYGNEILLSDIENKIVAILDFSFEYKEMSLIISKAQEVIWCDHHKSAKEKLSNFWNHPELKGIRDLTFSGCELTWQYFFKNIETPDIIKLIGDRDLWKFEFEGTIPFNERMYTISNNPSDSLWMLLLSNEKFVQNIIRQIISEGKILIEEKERRISKSFESGFDAYIQNYKTRIINSGNDVSEVGHHAVKQGYDIGFIWRQIGTKINCSLRSEGDVDVSEIAKKFGGGGHKNASGVEFNSYDEMIKVFKK